MFDRYIAGGQKALNLESKTVSSWEQVSRHLIRLDGSSYNITKVWYAIHWLSTTHLFFEIGYLYSVNL